MHVHHVPLQNERASGDETNCHCLLIGARFCNVLRALELIEPVGFIRSDLCGSAMDHWEQGLPGYPAYPPVSYPADWRFNIVNSGPYNMSLSTGTSGCNTWTPQFQQVGLVCTVVDSRVHVLLCMVCRMSCLTKH